MTMLRALAAMALTVALGILPAAPARGVTINGVPVTGNGSSTQAVPTQIGGCFNSSTACYNPNNGLVNYFVPLDYSNQGVYGVTGTSADSGTGAPGGVVTGLSQDGAALSMWLGFSGLDPNPATASLTIGFSDLDLVPVNDPHSGFVESVKLYAADGTALTGWILDTTSAPPYTITAGGPNQPLLITFPDITSLLPPDTTEFWIRLDFNVVDTIGGTNTPEQLRAQITTTPGTTPVTEPGSLLVMGAGLVGLGAVLRRRSARSRAGA